MEMHTSDCDTKWKWEKNALTAYAYSMYENSVFLWVELGKFHETLWKKQGRRHSSGQKKEWTVDTFGEHAARA